MSDIKTVEIDAQKIMDAYGNQWYQQTRKWYFEEKMESICTELIAKHGVPLKIYVKVPGGMPPSGFLAYDWYRWCAHRKYKKIYRYKTDVLKDAFVITYSHYSAPDKIESNWEIDGPLLISSARLVIKPAGKSGKSVSDPGAEVGYAVYATTRKWVKGRITNLGRCKYTIKDDKFYYKDGKPLGAYNEKEVIVGLGLNIGS